MKRKTKWVILTLALIWVFAMAATAPLIVTSIREKKAVEAVLQGYIAALIKQDFQSAYAICSSDFRGATSFEVFVEQHRELARRYGELVGFQQGSTEVSIQSAKVEWTARYVLVLEFKSKKVSFLYELHHENDHWVLYGYRLLHEGA